MTFEQYKEQFFALVSKGLLADADKLKCEYYNMPNSDTHCQGGAFVDGLDD